MAFACGQLHIETTRVTQPLPSTSAQKVALPFHFRTLRSNMEFRLSCANASATIFNLSSTLDPFVTTFAPASLDHIGIYYWRACTMLLETTRINCADRQVPNAPFPAPLSVMIGNAFEHGAIVSAIRAIFAIGIMGIGAILDKLDAGIGRVIALATQSDSGAAPGNCIKPLRSASYAGETRLITFRQRTGTW
jgi:hypothetical protein